MSSGNTYGKVTGDTAKNAAKAAAGNPALDEKNLLEEAQDGAKKAVDDWVEKQGDSKLAMAAGALSVAAIEVFMPTAYWELIPVGKLGKIAKKGAEVTGILKKGEKTAEAVQDVKKGEHAAEATQDVKKADNAHKPDTGGQKDTQVKKKKKLKCGEYGKYGKLKQKTGEGKLDRDHIPSKAALKTKAEEIKGAPLSKAEKSAIDNAADTIAIPRQAHIDVSPTHGQSLAEAANDAKDLAGSARRDVEAMLKKIDEYDADGGCKKAYQKSAKRVLKKSNADFDKWLVDTMKNANKK